MVKNFQPKIIITFASGICVVVRLGDAIEDAIEDKDWSSTDLVQYMKHQYENEKTVQKQ